LKNDGNKDRNLKGIEFKQVLASHNKFIKNTYINEKLCYPSKIADKDTIPYTNIPSKIMLKENIRIHNNHVTKNNQCKLF
jgi:hypothetical protein